MNKKLCQSCVLGKHIRLRFYESTSFTMSPFDIVHSDLRTSPIISSAGNSYYLLLLDDYSISCGPPPLLKNQMSFELF